MKTKLAFAALILAVGFQGTVSLADESSDVPAATAAVDARDHQGRGDHGGRDDHNRRGPGRRRQPQIITCYAQNRRGDVFEARGWNAYQAQQSAVDQCYEYGSYQCFTLGCR